MTPAGIEPATFRFVAQHLKHCATAVPIREVKDLVNLAQQRFWFWGLINIMVNFTPFILW